VVQARIVALNAQHFLKQAGNFVISIKASCIDSTAAPEAVFAQEVAAMQGMQLRPKEQVCATFLFRNGFRLALSSSPVSSSCIHCLAS
jgi:fibrillarin-like rRNA methylase